MSYFDTDEKDMLEVYMLETRQLLEQLETHLLETEKKHAFSKDEIHAVFRIMHTIKGSSAMMRLSGLSRAAHKLEDLFSYYRETYGMIEAPDPELFDLLFKASDFITKELERMGQDSYEPCSASDIENRAEEYLCKVKSEKSGKKETIKENGKEQETAKPEAENLPLQIPSDFDGKNGVIVRVTLEPGCRMEHIRAFMLVRQIGGLCSCVESVPKELEKAQSEAEYISRHGVLIRFESDNKNAVLDTLKKGLFVKACEVLEDRTVKIEEKKEPAVEKPVDENKEAEFLNVRMDRLDILQNLAEEMMIQMLTLENELDRVGQGEIKEGIAYQLNRLVGDMERTVMEMRMVPVSSLVPKLRRVFRDISRVQKKEVEFQINCGDIEADKSVIEYVFEALMHMLRNAVDHGIESAQERIAAGKDKVGRITFHVESTVGELILSIQDDGRGIDMEKIKAMATKKGLLPEKEEYEISEIQDMLYRPGFTTNDTVTEFSGRGVGLDVVKHIMEEAGGHLYMESEAGKGSKFTIVIPLTLATIECIRFCVGKCCFSLPARYVFRFMDYKKQRRQVQMLNGKTYLMMDDRIVPFIDLHHFYHLDGETPDSAVVVYLKNKEKEICIAADLMFEQKRIVVKPLPSLFGFNFRRNTGINGNSLMGDGTICSALDMEVLANLYESEGTYRNGK